MTNKDENWIKLLETNQITEAYPKGNIEQILKLSVQMVKTGTVTPKELGILGYGTNYPKSDFYFSSTPKKSQPKSSFSFNTLEYITTIVINLETKKIYSVYINRMPTTGVHMDTDLDKGLLNINELIFVKNIFYDSYYIAQQYHFKDNPNIIVEFRRDYNNEEKELFEYYKKNIDELQSFSEIYFEHKMRQ
ncbi:hypothetical protein QJU23_08550 [Pasteurella atlantica]|uniref:Uncharacterized protein n=2 Tax=Pasteurellaceae TaxID=712 RepID=A0ACC6HNK8_9PAST|nr:hypothetical protein [Pasteurella atlantica]MDP8052470.1 hypothetical protein [Pasteurella atlantica]MDP8105749.1 hypothetical protein [Pasteurella atlantica]MDP8149181.1 hypothetical protein [Pasteurella atlantica]